MTEPSDKFPSPMGIHGLSARPSLDAHPLTRSAVNYIHDAFPQANHSYYDTWWDENPVCNRVVHA